MTNIGLSLCKLRLRCPSWRRDDDGGHIYSISLQGFQRCLQTALEHYSAAMSDIELYKHICTSSERVLVMLAGM